MVDRGTNFGIHQLQDKQKKTIGFYSKTKLLQNIYVYKTIIVSREQFELVETNSVHPRFDYYKLSA